MQTITYKTAAGEKVSITGFGVFEKVHRSARMVRNPRTGERKKAKATAVPRFRAGTDLKAYVSGAKKVPRTAAKKGRYRGGPKTSVTPRPRQRRLRPSKQHLRQKTAANQDRGSEEPQRRRQPPGADRRTPDDHDHNQALSTRSSASTACSR